MSSTPQTTPTREALADYAHKAWAGWMEYMFSKSVRTIAGSIVIPPDLVERWERQCATAYEALPSHEQHSDREEADRMLAIIAQLQAPHIPIIVAAMEEAYAENLRKEYYLTLTPEKLFSMLKQNIAEIGLALEYNNDVRGKCADVANYAGFILRVYERDQWRRDASDVESTAIADDTVKRQSARES